LPASVSALFDALSIYGVTLPVNEPEEKSWQIAHEYAVTLKEQLATFPSIDSLFDFQETHDELQINICRLYVLLFSLTF
jgi:hypothetical protein